jgi:hypothetical protein
MLVHRLVVAGRLWSFEMTNSLEPGLFPCTHVNMTVRLSFLEPLSFIVDGSVLLTQNGWNVFNQLSALGVIKVPESK